jgi:hypothetical protein
LHPALTTAVLEEEFATLTGNHELLHASGILILKAAPPELRIAVRHIKSGTLHVFQFLCEDWDDQPPRLAVLDAVTGEELPGTRWPRNGPGQGYWHHDGWIAPSGLVLPKPFLCMRGIREYHEHKSHITDLWSSYRGRPDFTLANIVIKLAAVFQESHV